MFLHLVGRLPIVVHNSGPRSGVFFDLNYEIHPIPAPFNAGVVFRLDDGTPTVAGKATESVICDLVFANENITVADALKAFSATGPDIRVTITYKANRGPFGGVRAGQASQMVSQLALFDRVNEWSKYPPVHQ